MKQRLLMILTLVFITGLANGQSLKVKNMTGFDFEKVIIYKERDEGRHTFEYSPRYRFGGRDYSTPEIQKDTINYSSKIKFKENGKYTLEFISTDDTLCYLFGIDLNKTKKIVLDKSSLVYSRKPNLDSDETSDFGILTTIYKGRIDLYFNFINNSNYTIYAIYPWISDEDFQRGTILYHNPDRKILPKEQRKICVISERLENSYNNQKISFKIAATNSESKLVFFKIKDVELSADDVVIDDKSIEFVK